MTTATSQGEAHEVAKENKKAIQARNLRTGVLFTAPALIVLAIFVFYPAIQTFITSLTNGRINSNARRPAKFIGFQNYISLFQSQDFWTDVKNTLVYAVLYAPIVVIIALAFALLLNRKDLKFVGFFRTCMFLPFVISLTVAAIAWQFILSPSLGLIPYWVSLLGGPSHLDQRMAEVPLHHAAGPPPDLQLRGHLRPHRLLPGLRSGLHPDLRRPGPLH